MKTTDRQVLADMVIGPARREKLITRYADGLTLRWGMLPRIAYQYAAGVYDSGDPALLLAPGQVWTNPQGGSTASRLTKAAGRACPEYVVHGFGADGMVHVGDGHYMSHALFQDMLLTAWPQEYTLDDTPQPPATPIEPPALCIDDDLEDEEEDRFDPHGLAVLVERIGKDQPAPRGGWLPLLSAPYRPTSIEWPGRPDSYVNMLDVTVYLKDRLADFRAGWQPFLDFEWKPADTIYYFNEFGTGCECDTRVAAYIGEWLWERIRSDAVNEYGGTVADYDITFTWSPDRADDILDVAPYADPTWTLPHDHPLAQCEGQQVLFHAGGSPT